MKKWMGMLGGLILLGVLAMPVYAEPVEDPAFTFELDNSENQSADTGLRSVASTNLRVSASGVVGSTNSGWDTHFNSMLKYVVSDGDNVDMEGKWRMIYCLEYQKNYPNGILVWDNKAALNRKLTYCLFYGCRYWGATSVWPNYSTGDWKKDYWATQWAIHILNGEVSMDAVASNAAKDTSFSAAMAVVKKMVNAANANSNYTGFTTDYYVDISFSQDRTTATWTATTAYNNTAGYVTEWITPQLSDKYASTIREYARSLSVSLDTSGISVIKENARTMSRYRLWMSADTYRSYQKTGKNIVATASAVVPVRFGAWRYNAYNTNSQDCTMLEMSTTETYFGTKLATVKSSIPQLMEGTIAIEKVDAANESVRIPGAKLRLADTAGNVIVEFVSSAQPYVIEHVKPGTYVLSELVPPPGYAKTDPMQIQVVAGDETVTCKLKNLKYCDVTVTKRIPVTDTVGEITVPNLTWAHGNPSFLFEVRGTDLYGQAHCYRHALVFTKEYVDVHMQDGYVELSYTFSKIPQGRSYHITEQKVARYVFDKIDTADSNITIEETSAVADLVTKPSGSGVRFWNRKYCWDRYSHTDTVINTIPISQEPR